MRIQDIRSLEILDSRGNPTILAEVVLSDGRRARAEVPSGASTGSKEALELRDKDTRYGGKGVSKAVENIERLIRPKLLGSDVANQAEIDEILLDLDGTDSKSKLGANAILAVSMAVCRAGAMSRNVELFSHINSLFLSLAGEEVSCRQPVPMMNIINGGCHADNSLEIQEFMIQPRGFESFSEALRAGAEIFHQLKAILHKKGQITAVGDEGGFAPNIASTREALDVILEAIEAARYSTKQIKICLDVAGSELYKKGIYTINGKEMDLPALVKFFDDLIKDYPIVSIEDALAENDNAGWVEFTRAFGEKIQIVGDDLFTTNKRYLREGITTKMANSVLIKVNQIGTITETLECMALARKNGYTSIASHRSGETSDDFIADLAVGTGCGQIKTGSLSRSDRIAKYNRLLWLEKFAHIKEYTKL